MKAVPDEGVPRALAKALRSLGIATDPFPVAWSGLKNGALIRIAEATGYAVLRVFHRIRQGEVVTETLPPVSTFKT